MTFEYDGKSYALEFEHKTLEHPKHGRVPGVLAYLREGTLGSLVAVAPAFYKPGGTEQWSRRLMREAGLKKLVAILPVALRVHTLSAYWNRPRKTPRQRAQTKAFHRELRAIVGNGDLGPAERAAAELVLRQSMLRYGQKTGAKAEIEEAQRVSV